MEEKLVCPICGAPTRVYMGNPRKDRLCAKHADELKAGKITLCTDCGKYHNTNEKCVCATPREFKRQTIIINQENKSKCITCGKHTDGLLFCPSCYKKFKEKTLYFCIRNCSEVDLLDDSFEGVYVCKDGHVVKSKSEREIDNYLFENGIFHAYEKEIRSDDGTKLHPDFYLPNFLGDKKHVYIEHWGYQENNIQYTKTKKFKMPKYKEMKITLINTYEKSDARDLESALDFKLDKSRIKENCINFEEN